MRITRSKIRFCTFTLLLLCITFIGFAWIFPYTATIFCTDNNHALYDPKSYSELWDTALTDDQKIHNKEYWSKHFHSRISSEINYTVGNISEMLQPYLSEVEKMRTKLVIKTTSNNSKIQSKFHMVAANHEGYFTKLEQFRNVHTVKLITSLTSLRTHIRNAFYNGTSNDCDLFLRKSQPRNVLYSARKCEINPKNTFGGQTVELDDLRPGLPKDHPNSDSKLLLTHLHVIEGAVVSTCGDVYTNGLRILPIRCQLGKVAQQEIDLTKDVRHYFREVFTVSTIWGSGFYHWFIESLPRAAPYIEFLKKHPNIRIHVTEVTAFVKDTLHRLGLGQNELITGNVHADLIYMPAGITCGTPSWFPTQLQSMLFRQTMTWASEPRRSILLIKRSTRRYFYCHDYILNMLNKVSLVQ